MLDVSEESAVREFAREVVARQTQHVTLLINNAGVAFHGRFDEITFDDFRWLMNVDFWGVVYGVKYFLPAMEGAAARSYSEYFQHVWDRRARRGERVLGEQICGAPVYEGCDTNSRAGMYSFAQCDPGGIRTAIAQRARLGANTPMGSRGEAVAGSRRLTPNDPEECGGGTILQGVEPANHES